MKKLFILFIIPIFIISCQKDSVNETHKLNTSNANEPALEERYTSSQIRQAIVNLVSTTAFNHMRDSLLINAGRETLNLSELSYTLTSFADINILLNSNILFLYFPYIDDNYNNVTTKNVICLDNVTATSQLQDIAGGSVSVSSVETNFTVMYKTVGHSYDYKVDNLPDVAYLDKAKIVTSGAGTVLSIGGWLPWRRCYCRAKKFPDGGTSSTGTCSELKKNADISMRKCSRTGFINQDCPGTDC